MAQDEPHPPEYVHTWLKARTSKGRDIAEHLGMLESLLFKDSEISIPQKGLVVLTFKVAPHLANIYRTLHGGAIATLVDVLAMVAVKSAGDTLKGVSTDVNISYISGAPILTELEAEAKILRVGKTLAVASVDIRNKETRQLHVQGRVTIYLYKEEFSLATAKL